MTEGKDLSGPWLPDPVTRRNFLNGAAALGAATLLSGNVLAQSAVKRGGRLVLGVDGASASDSLDPALQDTDFMALVKNQIYDPLTYLDGGRLHPGIAESWDARQGAKEWIFKLRKDVVFHNGKPMTSADVIYSINHHRKPGSRSALRVLGSQIADVTASNPHEVTIILNGGDADLPYLLGDWHLGIVPEGSSFLDGVGTGPFVLETFEPGVRVRARRNTRDWKDRGNVESIEILGINDAAARLSALTSGSVHIISKVTPNTVALLERNPQIQVLNATGAGHPEFAVLCDTPPFDNADLRLALKYALDRETIMRTVLRNFGQIGNDQPIPAFDPNYADIPQRPYDPEKAKFHYGRSGHSGPLRLTVAEVAFPGAVDMAVIYQQSAAKAGIDIQINRVPNDGYYEEVWNKHPFYATYNSGRPTAGALFSYAYLSTAPNNWTHWKRPQFDELIVKARTELDPAKRKELYRAAQMMVHEDGGSIVIAFNNWIDAGTKRLGGFTPDPSRGLSGNKAPQKVWFNS